ncbi:MAG: SoxR reducing system RseC family protein [Spirochaetota bacterium]
MAQKGIEGEEGEVISVQGKRATVRLQPGPACAKCNLCSRISSTEMAVEALAEKRVRTGQKVVLSIRPGVVVKSAVILYIIPLIAMVVGYYCGTAAGRVLSIGGGELFPAAVSLIFLFGSFVPIRMYDKRKQKAAAPQVYIKDVK